jgi:predicted RNase H-like nuclease
LKTAGIDGCKAGWILTTFDENPEYRIIESDENFISALREFDRVFIDMPIGLASGRPGDDGRRACDRAARQRLGGRLASRVFSAPIRAVLVADSYAEACAVSRERTGQALSLQAWHICPKIRALDAFIRANGAAGRIREAHPELAFAGLNRGRPITPNKRSAEGREARLAVLASQGLSDADARIRAARRGAGGHRFSAYDDWLDALALTVGFSGADGVERLPDGKVEDAVGLPLHIHVPQLKR